MKKYIKSLAIAGIAILGLISVSNFAKAQSDDMSSDKIKMKEGGILLFGAATWTAGEALIASRFASTTKNKMFV